MLEGALMEEDHMQPCIQNHLVIVIILLQVHRLLEIGPFVSQEVLTGEECMFKLVKLFKVEHSQALMLYQEGTMGPTI